MIFSRPGFTQTPVITCAISPLIADGKHLMDFQSETSVVTFRDEV